MNFTQKGLAREVSHFNSKEDIAEVLTFVKEQKVPGELIVSLPGNGGVTAITFKGKEQSIEVEKVYLDDEDASVENKVCTDA